MSIITLTNAAISAIEVSSFFCVRLKHVSPRLGNYLQLLNYLKWCILEMFGCRITWSTWRFMYGQYKHSCTFFSDFLQLLQLNMQLRLKKNPSLFPVVTIL